MFEGVYVARRRMCGTEDDRQGKATPAMGRDMGQWEGRGKEHRGCD